MKSITNSQHFIQCFEHSFAIHIFIETCETSRPLRWYSFATNDASPCISQEHCHLIFIRYAITDIMPHTEYNTLEHSPDTGCHQLRQHMNHETKKNKKNKCSNKIWKQRLKCMEYKALFKKVKEACFGMLIGRLWYVFSNENNSTQFTPIQHRQHDGCLKLLRFNWPAPYNTLLPLTRIWSSKMNSVLIPLSWLCSRDVVMSGKNSILGCSVGVVLYNIHKPCHHS